MQNLCFYRSKPKLLHAETYAFEIRTPIFVKISAYFLSRMQRLIVQKKESYYTSISNFWP